MLEPTPHRVSLSDPLVIAGREFRSRLITGTGNTSSNPGANRTHNPRFATRTRRCSAGPRAFMRRTRHARRSPSTRGARSLR